MNERYSNTVTLELMYHGIQSVSRLAVRPATAPRQAFPLTWLTRHPSRGTRPGNMDAEPGSNSLKYGIVLEGGI